MRIIEGIANPIVIIAGWVFAISFLWIIAHRRSEFSNQELSNLAGLGAFIFIVESIIIPIPFHVFPIFYSISGAILIVTIAGTSRGIMITALAITLNHLFIPGSLSMLGTNLSNMIISVLLIGWLPSQIYYNPYYGRRIRYLGTFLGGFFYTIIEGNIILLELDFFYRSKVDLRSVYWGYFALLMVLGIIEGLFTAMAASYYHRTFIEPNQSFLELELDIADEDETHYYEIEKIDFSMRFIEKTKKEEKQSRRKEAS